MHALVSTSDCVCKFVHIIVHPLVTQQGHPEALLGLGELYEGRYHIDGTLGCFGLLPDENQAKHW